MPSVAIAILHLAGGGEAFAEFGTPIRTMTDGASELTIKQRIAERDHAAHLTVG